MLQIFGLGIPDECKSRKVVWRHYIYICCVHFLLSPHRRTFSIELWFFRNSPCFFTLRNWLPMLYLTKPSMIYDSTENNYINGKDRWWMVCLQLTWAWPSIKICISIKSYVYKSSIFCHKFMYLPLSLLGW